MLSVPINDIVVLAILTIIHIIAIVFTWKVGEIFGSKSWGLIVFAFILLLFRRIMSFLDLFGIFSYDGIGISMIDRIYLPMIIWILIAVGMARIYYKIRSSMELENRIKRVSKRKK